jgi:hypothetical protein
MLPFNLLRVMFANGMVFRRYISMIHRCIIGVQVTKTKWI